MEIALIFLACSVLSLAITVGVFRVEDARGGDRAVLVKLRELLDRFMQFSRQKLSKTDTYLGRGFVRLILHYAAHGVLNRSLSLIGRTEKKVENLLRRNKQVAKEIRTDKEKTHLDKISDHKEEFALTEKQKIKMRSHE